MKKNLILFTAFFMLFCVADLVAQTAHQDLSWAKSLMQKGDYAYAAQKFADIAHGYNHAKAIRKEAMYYCGYCHVKNNDPWQAKRVYERFLEKYDDGYDREFIPDALYVLGRVYEELGENLNAIKVYKRCRRNYPHNQFARKANERLRLIGGSQDTDPFGPGNDYDSDYNDDHNDGHDSFTGISRKIRHLLRIAKTVNNSYTRDQMLLEGAKEAGTGEDFIALAEAIENSFTRSQLLAQVEKHQSFKNFSCQSMLELAKLINYSYSRDQFLVAFAAAKAQSDYASGYDFVDISSAMDNDHMRQQMFDKITNSPAFKFMSALTVADLAKTCGNSYIRDQLLLTAAKNNYYSYRELRTLAEACSNSFTKTQIMQAGKDNDTYPGSYRSRTSSAAKTNPFANFKADKEQLKRVNSFMQAIDKKKNIQKAARLLKKQDLQLATVKEYMKKFRTMQNFDKLHH